MGACVVFAQSAISLSLVLCLVLGFSRKSRTKSRKSSWSDVRVCTCNGNNNNNKSEIQHQHQHQQVYLQPGASIMEQLVPEITQHMLSYLDHRSLCNVSMTNSCMRRVANDDSIWKALFHKDFTVEQSCVMLPYGWKAHYAVTKAVLEINRNFYKYFQTKSIKGMNHLWLNSDYIKCIHPNGELICGYDAIMDQWRTIFNWNQAFEFDLQEERVRVFGNMAWITVKEFINSATEPLLTTNVFELHGDRWYMVHHHSSIQLEAANFEFGPMG